MSRITRSPVKRVQLHDAAMPLFFVTDCKQTKHSILLLNLFACKRHVRPVILNVCSSKEEIPTLCNGVGSTEEVCGVYILKCNNVFIRIKLQASSDDFAVF